MTESPWLNRACGFCCFLIALPLFSLQFSWNFHHPTSCITHLCPLSRKPHVLTFQFYSASPSFSCPPILPLQSVTADHQKVKWVNDASIIGFLGGLNEAKYMKGLAWCLAHGGAWWTAVSIISVDVLNSSAYDLQACPYSQGYGLSIGQTSSPQMQSISCRTKMVPNQFLSFIHSFIHSTVRGFCTMLSNLDSSIGTGGIDIF